MTNDRLTGQYILRVKARVGELMSDLSIMSVPDLYAVGKIQGLIHGLNESLTILEALIEDNAQDD